MLPTIVVNHMLEPPGRVTGITRFLFAILAAMLDGGSGDIVLVTTWAAADLPLFLTASRLRVVTVPYYQQVPLNVAMQGPVIARLMKAHPAAVEFNPNPIGYFRGTWPRIITVHDLYLKLMPASYARRHQLTWNVLFPLSARAAHAIVVPSESTRQDLGRFHAAAFEKSIVVPEAPAFDLSSPLTAPPVTGRYGLMVGNLSPNKNAAVVVEALARLEENGHRVPIVHIGRDENGLLDAAQKRVALKSPIVSMPGISDGALRSAYTNAAFFLNTSLHEGFCLPVVEAQSCGTPVIASNRSALPEVAGDGAILVDPLNAVDVAAAIELLWTDAAAAGRLRDLGYANVARFSWANAARQVLDTITRISRAEEAAPAGAAGDRHSATSDKIY